MTIIRPYHYKKIVRTLFLFLGVILIGGLIYIYEYNALADTRFQLKAAKQKISSLETINADLKNSIYRITDPEKLGVLAKESYLVLDKNPQYLNSNQWLSDSSY